MSNDTAIQKYDDTLHSIAPLIRAYADEVADTELGLKIQGLAEQAEPTIKGIEGQQRVRFPILSLRQNSSSSSTIPEETRPGQLYTSQSDHVGDTLEFIPVYTHNIRKKWGEEKIDCQSLDGVTGSRYGSCKECPYGRYEPGLRPDCSSGTSYYILTSDLKHIYRIDFIKTSAKAGRAIRQLSLPPAMWSRSFVLSAKKVVGNNRNYFELNVTATNSRTSEEVSKVCDLLYEYFNSNYKKTLLLQEEYRKNAVVHAAATGSSDTDSVVDTEGSTDDINFRDAV